MKARQYINMMGMAAAVLFSSCVKDTLYDYGRWLYILSLLAKFIVKPRNIKAMFRYRWKIGRASCRERV